MRVLGLSASGHGAAACLVEDGRVVRALNLERLTRVKYAPIALKEHIPELERVLTEYFQYTRAPQHFDFYEWFPEMLHYLTGERTLEKAELDLVVKTRDNLSVARSSTDAAYERFLGYWSGVRTEFALEHHLCHAYQAYLSSPFDDAAILTIDGTGEPLERLNGDSISTTLGIGEGQRVNVLTEILAPSSVGGLYSNFTHRLGFLHEQEGNTMALASFGTDRFYRTLAKDSVEYEEGGKFELAWNEPLNGYRWLDHLSAFLPYRKRGEPLTQDHTDAAWAVQALTEDILLHVTRGLQARTGKKQIAVAGGVALNCVANTKILQETPFEQLYVMPNAGDRGLCVGAALYGYHVLLGGTERHLLPHDYLGKSYSETDARVALEAAKDTEFRKSPNIAKEAAALLAKGRIIGWVQGGAEFGPRALGHRSILADPRTRRSKERLDQDIKRREWFRPYAPSALAERANEFFEVVGPSPYMLLAVKTRPEVRERVAGIVHVDGSARVQTVERDVEPLYHRLISEFDVLTGIPILLNTSFNGYGEPVVETPEDAIKSLHSMGLDALVLGDFLVWKSGSPP